MSEVKYIFSPCIYYIHGKNFIVKLYRKLRNTTDIVAFFVFFT